MWKYPCEKGKEGDGILTELLRYAREYLPEWKPDLDHPDIGTVIARIFSGQMEEAAELRNEAVGKGAEAILRLRNPGGQLAVPAKTVLVAEPEQTAQTGIMLAKGSRFQGEAEDGGPPVVFRTVHDLAAGGGKLSAVLGISARKKKIVSYDPAISKEGLPLFTFSGENLYTEEIRLTHALLPEGEIAVARPRGCPAVRLSEARLCMGGAGLKPVMLREDEQELDPEQAEIFGREILPYKECLIGQEEAFRKPGAEITCTFELEWQEENQKEEVPEEELRPVVRYRKQKKPVRLSVYPDQIDVSYYNGKGFKNLEIRGMDSLHPDSGGRKNMCRITFVCPGDWEKQEAGGYEMPFLRLRILRAKNCYAPDAIHHFPVISHAQISWTFGEKGIEPEALYRRQGSRSIPVRRAGQVEKPGEEAWLFADFPYTGECMLLGFDQIFPPGGTGIFFRLRDPGTLPRRQLSFACSSEEGFLPLSVQDGTEGLSESGILRFCMPEKARMMEIEGKTCFWIRIEQERDERGYPCLQGLFPNGVEAENVEISPLRAWVQEKVEREKQVSLSDACILDARVWVNEQSSLTGREQARLLQQEPERVRLEKDSQGKTTAFYVRWERADKENGNPRTESRDGRYYILDRPGKAIIFGRDANWQIPRETEGIGWKIQTVSCQGARGNLGVGRITESVAAIPALRRVYNPEPATGGRDPQTEWDGRALPDSEKGDSMVTADDIHRLARRFSDSILQTAVETDGRGRLTVTVLTRRRQDYPGLSGPLGTFLKEKLPMAGRWTDVRIRGPVYVEVSVWVWATQKDSDPGDVKEKLRSRLYDFFREDRTEETSGFYRQTYTRKMGCLPALGQLREILQDTAGEKAAIQKLGVVLTWADERGRHTTELEEDTVIKNGVCVNGQHRVFLKYR